MQGFGALSRGIAIATLLCLAAPQAQAIEIYSVRTASTGLDEGLLVQVRANGARHAGYNRARYNRTGYARPGNLHGANRYGARGVYRSGNRNVYRNVYHAGAGAVWARPSGYSWPVGGAVAAGAALGFVSAAAAASWAGAAPGPNLCWYYTDPTRRQGFWDACP
jgi:hypothetical protein